MSADKQDHNSDEVRYQGEALLLQGRIDDLEREKVEREKDEKKYRDAQLALNKAQLRTNQWMALFTFLLVVCTAITGFIAIRQANIAKDAAKAAQQAADAASSNVNISAYALEQSEWSSDFTLQQMASQTVQQQIAASAARQSAQTAKLALHVSERAYLVRGDVSIDLDKKVITVNILNAGHLPTGLVRVVAHEAVISPSPTDGMVFIHSARVIESDAPSIAPGVPQQIKFTPEPFDPVVLSRGGQNVIIVGIITYNDGFQDEPDQTLKFCTVNQYHPQIRRSDFVGCNFDETIAKIKKWEIDPNVQH